MLSTYDDTPGSLVQIRGMQSTCIQELINLKEVLGYLREATACLTIPLALVGDTAAETLHKHLDLDRHLHNLKQRVADMERHHRYDSDLRGEIFRFVLDLRKVFKLGDMVLGHSSVVSDRFMG